MNNVKQLGCVLISLAVLFFASPVYADPPLPPSEEFYIPESDSAGISKGDILDIKVYMEDDLSGEYTVLEDGTISFPLLGIVVVEGLSKLEAEQMLEELLEKDYLVDPHVNIITKEVSAQKKVTIIGEVKEPGSYPFPANGGLNLVEAISMAGGFTRYASTRGVRVIRASRISRKNVITPDVNAILNGKKKDLELEPGDMIIVPESFF